MPISIFHTENNSAEEWLLVNEDGTLTHHIENTGWSMAGGGLLARAKNMKAQELEGDGLLAPLGLMKP